MYKVVMKIDGMMCGMCEAHINDVVRKTVKDARKVSSSHGKGECSFLCDNVPDREAVEEAIRQTGYELEGFSYEEYVKRGLFG